MTPPYEPGRELSPANYREMQNCDAYIDENIRECDEAFSGGFSGVRTESAALLEATQKASTSALAAQGSNLSSNANFSQSRRAMTSYPLKVKSAYRVFIRHCFPKLECGRCTDINCGFRYEVSRYSLYQYQQQHYP